MVSRVSLNKWVVELFGYDAIYEAFVKNSDHFSERLSTNTMSKYIKKGMLLFL